MSLKSAHSLIRQVAKKFDVPAEQVEKLLQADAEHQFEITLSGGGKYQAYRVQHNNQRGPYKGGIRFHPHVSLDEVRELALLMALKTAALGLPLGGGKGGVAVDPRQLSDSELEELSRAYAAQLVPHIGPDKDVPAPDVNTDARIIDWMVDEYAAHTNDKTRASFTGKSLANGGSEGREAATGRGGVIALAEVLGRLTFKNSISVAVQGFGNVGSFFATVAQADYPDWQLIAASDSGATITDADGFDAQELSNYKAKNARFGDYPGEAKILPAEDIISQPVDVLVLAALGDAITKDNMEQVQAKIILELANGPLSEEAYRYLSSKGVIIIPDILANGGGVIVSYLEWLQNRAEEHWTIDKVNTELHRLMTEAIAASWELSQQQNIPLKEAALAVAIKHLTPGERC